MGKEMHAGDGDQSKSSPENGGSKSKPTPPQFPNHSSTIFRRSRSADNFRHPGAADMDSSEEDLDDLGHPISRSDHASTILRRSQSADNFRLPGAADMDFSEDDLYDLGHSISISMSDDGSDNSVVVASSSESKVADDTVFAETNEAKKSVPSEKLITLPFNDPKNRKRKSAYCSKEQRARYAWELEESLRALRNEDTSLSDDLTLNQRVTDDMTNLQIMEKISRLLVENQLMREQVARLRAAAGMPNTDEEDHSDPPFSEETSDSELDLYISTDGDSPEPSVKSESP